MSHRHAAQALARMASEKFIKFEAYKVAAMAVHAAAVIWDGRTWVGPTVARELRKIADNLDEAAEAIRRKQHEETNGQTD